MSDAAGFAGVDEVKVDDEAEAHRDDGGEPASGGPPHFGTDQPEHDDDKVGDGDGKEGFPAEVHQLVVSESWEGGAQPDEEGYSAEAFEDKSCGSEPIVGIVKELEDSGSGGGFEFKPVDGGDVVSAEEDSTEDSA